MAMSARIITSKRSTSAFTVYDKTGNTLSARPLTTHSFRPFDGHSLQPTQNDGDPFVIYDQIADRWVISDFAFPGLPGSPFCQCIAVSQTPDPVSGGWFLYAVQDDPSQPNVAGRLPEDGDVE